MIFKPCNDYYDCEDAGKSCSSCRRNFACRDNFKPKSFQCDIKTTTYANPCDNCPNKPKDGETKICNCTLPAIGKIT